MSAAVRSLAWKEFRELLAGTIATAAIVLAIPGCYVFRDVGLALGGVMAGLAVYPLIGSVFFGMRAAAGERTNRTAGFVAALPISHRMLGVVRLVAALAAAAMPLGTLLLLAAILIPLKPDPTAPTFQSLLPFSALSGLMTFGCLSIAAFAGLGQPSEIRAGVVGFLAIVCAWLLGFAGLVFVLKVLASIAPEWVRTMDARVFAMTLTYVGCLGICLSALFPILYRRALEPLGDRSMNWWNVAAFLLDSARAVEAGLRSPLAALVWKSVREATIPGLLVLISCLMLSTVVGLIQNPAAGLIRSVATALPYALWIGGFVVAVLIGVGAVAGDVQPGVNAFWRSRPISPAAWYWTKLIVGLMTMFVAVELPYFLCTAAGMLDETDVWGLGWWILIWTATYSFAVTATCLVRQPAQAGILAIGAVGILYASIQAAFGSFLSEPAAAMPSLFAAFAGAAVLSIVGGWWAAKHDIAIS